MHCLKNECQALFFEVFYFCVLASIFFIYILSFKNKMGENLLTLIVKINSKCIFFTILRTVSISKHLQKIKILNKNNIVLQYTVCEAEFDADQSRIELKFWHVLVL